MKRKETLELLKKALPGWEVVYHLNEAAAKSNVVVVRYEQWLDRSDWWAYIGWIKDNEVLSLNHCRLGILPKWVVLHEAAHVLDGPNRFIHPHNKRWRRLNKELQDKFAGEQKY